MVISVTHFGDISAYMLDGQLALQSPVLVSGCVTHQTRNMCVHLYKPYFMAGSKKTGYTVIFCRVFWLVKLVHVETQYILYI